MITSKVNPIQITY